MTMTTKPLDPDASELGKQQGMADAEANAPIGWQDNAVALIRHLAGRHPYICADDLWAAGLEPPPEPRALGPAFVEARKLGIIAATPNFVLTTQVERHRAPVRIWKSKLCGGVAPFDETALPSRIAPTVQA